MSDNAKVVAALLVGVAAGAALGILFAPEKGSETREKLNDSIKDLGETLKERSQEQLGQISEMADQVLSALKSKLGKMDGPVEEMVEEHA